MKPLLNPESMLVVSLGLCFAMVVIATKAGFTPALGAFVMGSLLADTGEGALIGRVVRPVRDLFSAVLLILSLHVVRETLYPLAVSVSVLTAFTTPYLIKGSDGIYRSVQRFLHAHLVQFLVPTEAECVGKSLAILELREKFETTVVLIKRGLRRITAPGRDEVLMPLDQIFVIRADERLLSVKFFLDHQKSKLEKFVSAGDYNLVPLTVTEANAFIGKSIRESGLRRATKGLVVGLERFGTRMLNPDPNFQLRAHDVLWIVGDRSRIRHLEH